MTDCYWGLYDDDEKPSVAPKPEPAPRQNLSPKSTNLDTSAKRVDGSDMSRKEGKGSDMNWKVGDKVMFPDGVERGTIRALHGAFAWVSSDGGTALHTIPIAVLARPAPRKRTVVIEELKGDGNRRVWVTEEAGHKLPGLWLRTGRTHTFEVEEDADGDQG